MCTPTPTKKKTPPVKKEKASPLFKRLARHTHSRNGTGLGKTGTSAKSEGLCWKLMEYFIEIGVTSREDMSSLQFEAALGMIRPYYLDRPYSANKKKLRGTIKIALKRRAFVKHPNRKRALFYLRTFLSLDDAIEYALNEMVGTSPKPPFNWKSSQFTYFNGIDIMGLVQLATILVPEYHLLYL
jgi:hypothetical protein